ncbi:hypothetical protein BST61_g4120 [Cercospora zeina]
MQRATTPVTISTASTPLAAEDREIAGTKQKDPRFSVVILIYWRETSHTEELDKVQKALALVDLDQISGTSEDTPQTSTSNPNEDLILFSFRETESAAKNLEFFLKHALHAKADFIFIINGEHTQNLSALHELTNVAYKRFMLVNDSVRGPFFPSWAEKTCWSDAYWGKLDETTKLAGMSWNCANGANYPPHLQSMILAFTRETLQMHLLPKMKCYQDMEDAVTNGETRIAGMFTEEGHDVYAMEGRFAAHAGPTRKNTTAFLEWCVDTPETAGRGGDDVLYSGHYEGSTLHPYETIFVKTNRPWDERDRKVIDLLTEHADLSEYSSYDHCR